MSQSVLSLGIGVGMRSADSGRTSALSGSTSAVSLSSARLVGSLSTATLRALRHGLTADELMRRSAEDGLDQGDGHNHGSMRGGKNSELDIGLDEQGRVVPPGVSARRRTGVRLSMHEMTLARKSSTRADRDTLQSEGLGPGSKATVSNTLKTHVVAKTKAKRKTKIKTNQVLSERGARRLGARRARAAARDALVRVTTPVSETADLRERLMSMEVQRGRARHRQRLAAAASQAVCAAAAEAWRARGAPHDDLTAVIVLLDHAPLGVG